MVPGKLYFSIVLVFVAIKEQRSTRCHQTVVKLAIFTVLVVKLAISKVMVIKLAISTVLDVKLAISTVWS